MRNAEQAPSDVCLRAADVSWVLQKSPHLPPQQPAFALPLFAQCPCNTKLSMLMRAGPNGKSSWVGRGEGV